MRVKCISNNDTPDQPELGKWYESFSLDISVFPNYYLISEIGFNKGIIGLYDKSLFITLNEIRENKLNEILNES